MTKYLAVVAISASNRLAYTREALVRSAFYLMILFVLIQLWSAIFAQQGGTVAGFGPLQMVGYLVMTEALLLSWPPFEIEMSEEVVSGQVAYRLLRPVHFVGMWFGRYVGEFLVNFTLNLSLGLLAFRLFFGSLGEGYAHPLALLTVITLATSLHFLMVCSIGLLSFWLEQVRPFRWIYDKVLFTLGGLLIPIDAFRGSFRDLLDFLPFARILYAPARLTVSWDAGFFRETLVFGGIWILLMLAVVTALYRRGVKNLHAQGG